jgi:hypothetical protein
MPIYNLALARADGTLGSKLQRSSADCSTAPTPGRGETPQASNQGQRPACGIRLGPGVMSAGGRSVAQLANTLAQFVQRPVANRTGLEGLFDFDLFLASPLLASEARPSTCSGQALRQARGSRANREARPGMIALTAGRRLSSRRSRSSDHRLCDDPDADPAVQMSMGQPLDRRANVRVRTGGPQFRQAPGWPACPEPVEGRQCGSELAGLKACTTSGMHDIRSPRLLARGAGRRLGATEPASA